MENQVKFDAEALGFYPKPKFEVVLRDGRFKLLDLPGNHEVDRIAAGVYAWVHVSAHGGLSEVRYIGLFGQRAKHPSFRRRMHQHLRGLTSSLAGKAPTKHWEHVLVPSLLIDLEGGGSVQMYLRHAERHEVNDLETNLIAQFSPPWNAAKNRALSPVAVASHPSSHRTERNSAMPDAQEFKRLMNGANEPLAKLWSAWEGITPNGPIGHLKHLCELAHQQGLDIYTTRTRGFDIRFGCNRPNSRERSKMYIRIVCRRGGIKAFEFDDGLNHEVTLERAEELLHPNTVSAWRARKKIVRRADVRGAWPTDYP